MEGHLCNGTKADLHAHGSHPHSQFAHSSHPHNQFAYSSHPHSQFADSDACSSHPSQLSLTHEMNVTNMMPATMAPRKSRPMSRTMRIPPEMPSHVMGLRIRAPAEAARGARGGKGGGSR